MAGKRKTLILIFLIIVAIISLLIVKAEIDSLSQVAHGANLVWEKTYGDTGDDRVYDAIPTSDGFLVVGSSTSFIKDKTVAWAIQIDREGNVIWSHTYAENVSTEFRCTIALPDGFLFVGNMLTNNPNGYIVKIDQQGNVQWNTTLGVGLSAKLWSAVKTEDGFALAGFTTDSPGKIWVAKITDNGAQVWSKTFGGIADCAGRAIALSPDGGYAVSGYINDTSVNTDYDFLLCKFDVQGNMLWNKTYGESKSDKAYAMLTASDGYVMTGDTCSKGAGSYDAWIVKVDWNGNTIWNKTVGGSDFDETTCISSSTDGGYLVGGWTLSFGNGKRDFCIFKLDNSGNQLWSCTVGRSNYEEAYAVCEVSANELVVAGWKNMIENGVCYDFYVVDITVENNIENWLQNNQLAVLAVVSVVSVALAVTTIKKFYKK